MVSLKLWALAGTALVMSHFSMYVLGQAHVNAKWEKAKAQAAVDAALEKENDAAAQKAAADVADAKLLEEMRRLNHKVERSRVTTGLDCDVAGSGDSVWDAYNEIYSQGLHSGISPSLSVSPTSPSAVGPGR